MVDFGRLLAALDLTGVLRGVLGRYFGMRSRVGEDVLESDLFTAVVLDLRGSRKGCCSITSWRLLDELQREGSRPPSGWPSPNRFQNWTRFAFLRQTVGTCTDTRRLWDVAAYMCAKSEHLAQLPSEQRPGSLIWLDLRQG